MNVFLDPVVLPLLTLVWGALLGSYLQRRATIAMLRNIPKMYDSKLPAALKPDGSNRDAEWHRNRVLSGVITCLERRYDRAPPDYGHE